MSRIKGVITEIKRFATHDGPGIRTTIFCKGCHLNCRWCSNPETINPQIELYFISQRCKKCAKCVEICPEGALGIDKELKIDRHKCNLCMKCVEECPFRAFQRVGDEITADEAVMEVEKDLAFYGKDGGLTICGGEPLYQPEFSISILKQCRERGISTVLDTSGFASKEIIQEAVEFTDIVLLDIKHMDSEKHRNATGVDNRLILENAIFMAQKTEVRISFPVIPGFNDSEENITQTAKFAVSSGIRYIDVLPMHILGSSKYKYLGMNSPYERYRELTPEDLKEIVGIFLAHGLEVTVGRML